MQCKTALSKSLLPGLDYSLNPYRGCEHNCAYCYAPNVLNVSRDKWGTFVSPRMNIPRVLSDELRRKKPGVIGLSTVSDPYQPIEKKYRLTRYCLEQLCRHDFPVSIQTKSDLVLRDLDLLRTQSHFEVGITLTTFDDNERLVLEPRSSSIDDRLKVLQKLGEENIKTFVFLGPIFPTLEREQIPVIMETFACYGVSEVMVDKFNLKPGVWHSLEQALTNNPSLKQRFIEGLFKEKTYYKDIFSDVFNEGEKHGVQVSSAFPDK